MAQILRQSTQIVVQIGPFVDVGDGFTPETGVTLSGADEAELLKGGATSTTSISAATWAAITGCAGWYNLTLTTSHTDTVGPLTIMVNDDSVCLPVFARFQVIEEAIYDALFAGSATGALPVSSGGFPVGGFAAGAITATAIATDAITAAKIAADAIGASELATDAVTEIQSGLATSSALATAQADLDTLTGTDGATLATAQGNYAPAKAGDEMDLVDAPNATAVTAIQSGTATAAELAKVPKSDGTTSWNATALAAINAEADTALSDYDAPTKSELDSGLAGLNDPTAAAIADAVWEEAIVDHSGTGGSTAEALDGASAPTAGEVADAVLDEALSGHTTAGTLGKSVADIEADATAILADTAEIGAAGAGLTEAGGDGDHLTEAGGTGDQLTAVPEVDANVKKVNDVTVTGDGSGTPWGPA